jgi:hypothetical protein
MDCLSAMEVFSDYACTVAFGFCRLWRRYKSKIDSNRPPFFMTDQGIRLQLFSWRRMETSLRLSTVRQDGRIVALNFYKEEGIEKGFQRKGYLTSIDLGEIRSNVASQRTVLFIKNMDFVSFSVSGKELILLVKTDSLLRNGFTFCQQGVGNCHQSQTQLLFFAGSVLVFGREQLPL